MFVAQSPFERLRLLLRDEAPGGNPIDLTVGSPRHAPPAFVPEVLAKHADGFGPYPPIAGTAEFRGAVHDWLDARYDLAGILREKGDVLPLNGSREGLTFAAFLARDLAAKERPAILFANPFYQAYPAAAHALGAQAVPLAAAPGSILPDFERVPQATLARAIAYYVASPSNPEGRVASLGDWHTLFDLAERHDFFVLADECYSELYREAAGPPVGALQAARDRPESLARLFVFNSLSKRSNLAGMRVGFVAGAAAPMAAMREFRNQAAPQVPTPLQAVAAAAYRDEVHVEENRRLYDEKFADAGRVLGKEFGQIVPRAGFFLWLPTGGDDVALCRTLWREAGVRAVPGSYLAATPADGGNPGAGYVRFALVAAADQTREALGRVAELFARKPHEALTSP